jgi:hypothetical protein
MLYLSSFMQLMEHICFNILIFLLYQFITQHIEISASFFYMKSNICLIISKKFICAGSAPV